MGACADSVRAQVHRRCSSWQRSDIGWLFVLSSILHLASLSEVGGCRIGRHVHVHCLCTCTSPCWTLCFWAAAVWHHALLPHNFLGKRSARAKIKRSVHWENGRKDPTVQLKLDLSRRCITCCRRCFGHSFVRRASR